MSTPEITDLLAKRDEAAAAYYEGEPIMSDAEFDELTVLLAESEVDEVVGHGYAPATNKVTHARPALSLAKVYTNDEVSSWLTKMNGHVTDGSYLIEPKYDGLAMILTYDEEGLFAGAATRGNGRVGEDVTAAVKVMIASGALPGLIEATGKTETVIGEVYVTYPELVALNAKRAAAGKDLYKNPRNTATGIIRRQSDNTDSAHLSFVAYETTIPGEGVNATARLAAAGFTTPLDHGATVATAEKVTAAIAAMGEAEKEFTFDTDGVVVKLRATDAVRDSIGVSSHAPRWAVAFKFPTKEEPTEVLDVVWSLTRTGRIVPVVVFEPVDLNATVTRATLHNAAIFEYFDLHAGDTILVKRAGEVIPHVAGKVATNEAGVKFTVPTLWPTADGGEGAVTRSATGLDLRAPEGATNTVAAIDYSLKALDVKGVGSALISDLVDAGQVASVLDMLNLTAEDIIALPGYENSATKAANYVNALNTALDQPLGAWVAAMGIPWIAKSKSPRLAERFGSLEAIADAQFEQIAAMETFGEKKAQSVLDHADMIHVWAKRLRDEHGFVPANPVIESEAQAGSDPVGVADIKVVVTGTFPTMSRKDVEAWVVSHGGTISSSVSSSTGLLIYGEKAGSKLSKATQLGTATMKAEEFEGLIRA